MKSSPSENGSANEKPASAANGAFKVRER
jgi:hypothetical protein